MKILMLHGFSQSGPHFKRKLRRLQSALEQRFPGVQLYWPTAPVRLEPKDLSSSQKKSAFINGVSEGDEILKEDTDAYAWFKINDESKTPAGYEQSLVMLCNMLKNDGPFDGFIGFSQGTAMGIMIASMLEGQSRMRSFERVKRSVPEHYAFPSCFRDIRHPPLKFGVTAAAFMSTDRMYRAFFRDPYIQTPFLHFRGQCDTFNSTEMVRAIEDARIGDTQAYNVDHPGGHIFPTDKQYLDRVVDFIAPRVRAVRPVEPPSDFSAVVRKPGAMVSTGTQTDDVKEPPSTPPPEYSPISYKTSCRDSVDAGKDHSLKVYINGRVQIEIPLCIATIDDRKAALIQGLLGDLVMTNVFGKANMLSGAETKAIKTDATGTVTDVGVTEIVSI